MEVLFGDGGTLVILCLLVGVLLVLTEKKIIEVWRWFFIIAIFYIGVHGLFASDQGEIARALKPTASVVILLVMVILKLFKISVIDALKFLFRIKEASA